MSEILFNLHNTMVLYSYKQIWIKNELTKTPPKPLLEILRKVFSSLWSYTMKQINYCLIVLYCVNCQGANYCSIWKIHVENPAQKNLWEFFNEKETFVKQKCFVTHILLAKKNPALVQLICSDVRLGFSKVPKEVKWLAPIDFAATILIRPFILLSL